MYNRYAVKISGCRYFLQYHIAYGEWRNVAHHMDSFSTDLCTEHSHVFPSKGELRRLVQGGGFSINKEKIDNPETVIWLESLLNNKYLLVQKGKKNYYLIRVS